MSDNTLDITGIKDYENASQIYQYNLALIDACEKGHKDIAELMIEKGATDLNFGMINACLKGHKDIVLLLIEKGAIDFFWGLINACRGGHKNIVELMLKKHAKSVNIGLSYACDHGHKDIVLLLIEYGANIDKCTMPLNHIDLEYLIKKQVNLTRSAL